MSVRIGPRWIVLRAVTSASPNEQSSSVAARPKTTVIYPGRWSALTVPPVVVKRLTRTVLLSAHAIKEMRNAAASG